MKLMTLKSSPEGHPCRSQTQGGGGGGENTAGRGNARVEAEG